MLNQKILILDEDPDVVDELQIRIESFGFECVTYSNMDMALEDFNEVRPDLILMDIECAETHGKYFINNLKDYLDSDMMYPPIIFMHNNDDTEIEEHAMDLGATACICKANDDQSLKTMLTDYLPVSELSL